MSEQTFLDLLRKLRSSGDHLSSALSQLAAETRPLPVDYSSVVAALTRSGLVVPSEEPLSAAALLVGGTLALNFRLRRVERG